VAADGLLREAQDLGGLGVSQTDEKVKLDHFGTERVFQNQFLQGFVNLEQLLIVGVSGDLEYIHIRGRLPATMLGASFAPGAVHQNVAHRLGGCGEEVGTALPVLAVGARQAQPRFMDQGRGLKGLTRRLLGHPRAGESAQFFIDQWQQFLGGRGVPLLYGIENLRYVIHWDSCDLDWKLVECQGWSLVAFRRVYGLTLSSMTN
jgi:hypothetical protein